MSLKASKKVDKNRYELEIIIDGEKFSDAIQTVYKKNVKKISVPGFRKGKAPLKIIEGMYGEGFFYEDALNLLYSDAIDEAAAEAGLTIINDKMDFDLVSINKKDGVDFKVTLTVKPEIEIKNYKGLKAEKVKPTVSNKELEDELKALADRNARMVTVEDRAAALGDTVVIDFEGFLNDKAFNGGKGENYSLPLGSGQFIPGFEDQIVGHKAGDEFDVNVTFPKEYGEASLAGKDVVFKVKLHEIKVKELPVIDDEFAKDVSEFDTLKELKADNKKKALEHKEKHAEEDVETQLIEQLVKNVKGDIPEAMYNNRIEQSIKDFEYRLQMQGMRLEQYLQFTGSDMDKMKQDMRPQAENQVKTRLALEAIAKLEKLEASDDEIADEYKKLAEDYKVDVDRIKAAIPEIELKEDIAVRKAMDFVKSNAEITEVEAKTEKKAPAKKPAAKSGTAAKKPAAKKTTSTTKKATASSTAKKPAAKKTDK